MTLAPPAASRSAREWEPSRRQGVFLRRSEYEVLYGGGKMGGKTDVLLMWSILRRQKYPKSRGLFIRRQITEITKQGAAWDRAHELLGDRVSYVSSPIHRITFPNGSVLEFNHCNDEESKQGYQGAQYDDICFDQLEQFTQSMYTFIGAACRVPTTGAPKDGQGLVIQPRIRASANPGSIGHAWVKTRFVDVAQPEQPYSYTETVRHPDGHDLTYTRDRVFVPSLLFDNPHADPAYAATLMQLQDTLKQAYLYGRWDIYVGQAFPDFKPRLEDGTPWHVIPAGPVPTEWAKVEGHDYGFSAPFYHCWGAIDPNGGLIIYKELSAQRWKTNEIASQVLLKRGSDLVGVTYTDNYPFQSQRSRLTQQMEETLAEKGQLLRSINEQYIEAGLNTMTLVPNMDRIAGKQKLHQLLADRGDLVPYLRIMDTCPILIKTMGEIPIDEDRIEDVKTKYSDEDEVQDHPYDGLRYLVMGSNIPIRRLIPAEERADEGEPTMSWGGRRRR